MPLLTSLAALGLVISLVVLCSAGKADAAGATLDGTFGRNGRVLTRVGPGDAHAMAIAEDSHHRLVVAGWTGRSRAHDILLVRYLEDGRLDTSFGTGGIVTTDLGGGERGLGMKIDSAGRIVVVGSQDTGSGPNPLVVRYSPEGLPDMGYSLILPLSGSAYSVVLDSQGRAVISGGQRGSGYTGGFAARISAGADASLDPSFGAGGIAHFPGFEVAAGVVIDRGPDGQAGTVYALCAPLDVGSFAAARLDSEGELDPSFGGDGIVRIFAGGEACAHSIALGRGGGRYLLAGRRSFPEGALVAQLRIDGTPYEPFTGDGKTEFHFPGGDVWLNAISANGAGTLVAGRFLPSRGGPHGFALASLDKEGHFVKSFGGDGRVVTRFGKRLRAAEASAVLLTSRSKSEQPVLAGFAGPKYQRGVGPRSFVALAKYGGKTCLGRAVTIEGTVKDERLVGTPGDDVILGSQGDDVIVGGGGGDRICGLGGSDRIDGGRGDDLIAGSFGADRVTGGGGADHIWGGAGDDRITGSSGNDVAFGNADRDRVFGAGGSDRIYGGQDADVLGGGAGNDLVLGGPGRDRVSGGPGRNRVGQGPIGPFTTTYEMKRPGLSVFFAVKGNRVQTVRVSYRQHCDNGHFGGGASYQTNMFNRPINPRTHRFSWSYQSGAHDYVSFTQNVHGRVGPEAIIGSFADRSSNNEEGAVFYHCWSGRSYAHPVAHFRARRVTR